MNSCLIPKSFTKFSHHADFARVEKQFNQNYIVCEAYWILRFINISQFHLNLKIMAIKFYCALDLFFRDQHLVPQEIFILNSKSPVALLQVCVQKFWVIASKEFQSGFTDLELMGYYTVLVSIYLTGITKIKSEKE